MSAPAPTSAASAAPTSAAASSSASSSSAAAGAPRNKHPDRTPHLRVLTGHRLEDGSVYVYQAYRPAIGLEAAKQGNFTKIPGFSPTRMTWIKFSLGWMLYRCNYAASKDQEVVLRIRLSASALDTILRAAVGSTWNRRLYPTKAEWQAAMAASEVRYQWDPERDLSLVKFPHNQRALQLGLAKSVAQRFANDPTWILSIEDCTEQVRAIKRAVDKPDAHAIPAVPLEQTIPIDDPQLRRSLAMDLAAGEDEQEEEAPAAAAGAGGGAGAGAASSTDGAKSK